MTPEEESIPGRENGKCKGPEIGVCLASLRDSKEARAE